MIILFAIFFLLIQIRPTIDYYTDSIIISKMKFCSVHLEIAFKDILIKRFSEAKLIVDKISMVLREIFKDDYTYNKVLEQIKKEIYLEALIISYDELYRDYKYCIGGYTTYTISCAKDIPSVSNLLIGEKYKECIDHIYINESICFCGEKKIVITVSNYKHDLYYAKMIEGEYPIINVSISDKMIKTVKKIVRDTVDLDISLE